MDSSTNPARLAILRSIQRLQDQMLRIQTFSTQELQNLRDLFDSLMPASGADPGSLPQLPPPPLQSAFSGGAPIRTGIGAESALSGQVNDLTSSRGVGIPQNNTNLDFTSRVSRSDRQQVPASNLIPPPPPSPISRDGPGVHCSTAPDTRGSSDREGTLLVHQASCCPHCHQTLYIKVASHMQAEASSGSTEAVLRFRVHVLTLQEMLDLTASDNPTPLFASTPI